MGKGASKTGSGKLIQRGNAGDPVLIRGRGRTGKTGVQPLGPDITRSSFLSRRRNLRSTCFRTEPLLRGRLIRSGMQEDECGLATDSFGSYVLDGLA